MIMKHQQFVQGNMFFITDIHWNGSLDNKNYQVEILIVWKKLILIGIHISYSHEFMPEFIPNLRIIAL